MLKMYIDNTVSEYTFPRSESHLLACQYETTERVVVFTLTSTSEMILDISVILFAGQASFHRIVFAFSCKQIFFSVTC